MLKKVGPNFLKAAMLLHILQNVRISVIHYVVKGRVKFTQEQAAKAQKMSRSTVFFNLGARWGWVVNATPRALYPPGLDPVLIV
jgi:hypothetical protein